MSRGRTPRTANHRQNVVSRAVDHVELLEDRRLMTTLVGGQTFHYLDASLSVVRVRLLGAITAEFTAARVRDTNNTVVVRDLIEANPPGVPQQTDGADLFNIYVAEAAPDAQIIITRVANTNVPDRDVTPYGGAVGNIRAVDTGVVDDPDAPVTGGNSTVAPDASGAVYIGARTVDVIDNTNIEEDIPIVRLPFNRQLGVRPNTRVIFAGVQTAVGVSMGKILIAGTITGIVNIEGSINTFYAGNIFTGSPGGVAGGLRSNITNNFNVGGDLDNLYVNGSVGTTSAGNYRTGVNMRIGGRLGHVHANGAFAASVQVRAAPSATAINDPVEEVETFPLGGQTAGTLFMLGELSGVVANNSAAEVNNQFAASFGVDQQMSWAGSLQTDRGDTADNYSLPLLAGQSATIQLTSLSGLAAVGVFDPLGRLIATDIPGVAGNVANQAFQFTANLPGVYRLAVAFVGTATFGGAGTVSGTDTYTLSAYGVGDVTFGGADISGRTRFREPGNGVAVRTGDMGGWVGRGNISGLVTVSSVLGESAGSPINLSRGDLRALYGANVGVETPAESLQLVVPRGSVGYIRATNDVAINAAAVDVNGDPRASAAIGGDYQRVEAGGEVDSILIANGSIGSIIAGSINTDNTSVVGTPIYSANTDQRGADGNIDMIYVTGDVGAANRSGPGLYNGVNGNVKYFHVGGVLNRDRFFTNAFEAVQTYRPGQAVRLRDDSGAIAVITPTEPPVDANAPVVPPVPVDPNAPVVPTAGFLTISQYGVRGTGGGVIVDLESSTNFTVTSLGNGGSFDITDAVTNSTGSPVFANDTGVGFTSGDIDPGDVAVVDPITGLPTNTLGRTPSIANPIIFGGRLPVNVFNVTGNNVTSLLNTTSGELVSGDFASLGLVVAQTIGRSANTSGAAIVVPTNFGGNAFPFDGFNRGIDVAGNVASVLARDGTGSINVGGVLGTLNPNADRRNARGQFDGIGGPIQAGTLRSVNIGEGIAFGGTGLLANAGLFAVDQIVNVSGVNADIRGPIASQGTIGSINLTDGSIVNTTIGVVDAFEQVGFNSTGFVLPEQQDAFSLNQINITGNGGMLGSRVAAARFGQINVGGYGILASTILATSGSGSNGTISAGGLGIRFSAIDVGDSINRVEATGNGRVLSISDFNSRVVQTGNTRRRRFDAYSGRLLTFANDLNRMFGTSRTSPRLSGATNAGVIQDTALTGAGDLGSLSAFAIGTANSTTSLGSSVFPMRVSFANSVGTISTDSSINGMKLNTGSLDALNVGNNLQRSDIGVAGEIGAINVGRTIRGTTSILAQGAGGAINSIVVRGGLYGTVRAQRSIGTIAAGEIGSLISTSGGITRVAVNGDIFDGSNIRAARNIDRVIIGGNFEQGAVIDADDIGVFRVGGTNAGSVVNL